MNIGNNLIGAFLWDECGATAVEYGIMITLIALAIFAAVTALGISVNDLFQSHNEELEKAIQSTNS